jgi:hypothetical protein
MVWTQTYSKNPRRHQKYIQTKFVRLSVLPSEDHKESRQGMRPMSLKSSLINGNPRPSLGAWRRQIVPGNNAGKHSSSGSSRG